MTYTEKAESLGKEHGTNVAEFDLQYIIGGRVPANLALSNAKAIAKAYDKHGYVEGVVEIYGPDLSTQKLTELVTGNTDTEPDEELYDSYRMAYGDAAQDTIINAVREYLNECENATH